MEHPSAIRPEEHADFRPDKMGKSTLFASERMLVGLNCFEPGQEHALHAHAGMDKLYVVVRGAGEFLLEGRPEDPRGVRALPMAAGQVLVAPEGIPHGIRNTGSERLIVLAVLAPGPT
jgi:oxalate decarboxylase/phosphoglucose isomerase-like protein (cupin superfamily)